MSRNDAATRPPHKRGLGVPAIALMIIAASAPMTVVAGGATTAFGVTQSIAVPIGYIVLGIALAIFAIGYAAMSRHITNTGAFYSYVSQGISKPVGVGVSLVALITYNCMQIGIYGVLGFTVSATIEGWTDGAVAIPWWIWVGIAIIIVAIMGMNRIDLSAKVLGTLVALEFLVVIVFDFAGFINPTEAFTAQPMSPAELFTPGIGAVLVFGVAAFMGFEQAALYGEEAKDPKRTVARATFVAVIIIGIFYAISTWALALGIGQDKITSGSINPDLIGPPLFFGFVDAHLAGWIVIIMHLLFFTSIFAAVASFHNAVARYFFALGREGLLPKALGRRSKGGAPVAGSLTQTVLAVIVVAIFAIVGADPIVTLFNWLTNTGAMGLVLLMTIVSIAVMGFFWTKKRDAGVWSRFVAPLIAFVILAVIYVLVFMNFNVLLGVDSGNFLALLFPLLLLAAGVAGIIWAFILKEKRPHVYARIGLGNPELDADGGAEADARPHADADAPSSRRAARR